jgi:hypothetical protein
MYRKDLSNAFSSKMQAQARERWRGGRNQREKLLIRNGFFLRRGYIKRLKDLCLGQSKSWKS